MLSKYTLIEHIVYNSDLWFDIPRRRDKLDRQVDLQDIEHNSVVSRLNDRHHYLSLCLLIFEKEGVIPDAQTDWKAAAKRAMHRQTRIVMVYPLAAKHKKLLQSVVYGFLTNYNPSEILDNDVGIERVTNNESRTGCWINKKIGGRL